MKVLEIVNNEAKFSINGEIYLPINDISKDDLLTGTLTDKNSLSLIK